MVDIKKSKPEILFITDRGTNAVLGCDNGKYFVYDGEVFLQPEGFFYEAVSSEGEPFCFEGTREEVLALVERVKRRDYPGWIEGNRVTNLGFGRP